MVETKTTNIWKPYVIMLLGVFVMMVILGMNTPAYPKISADLGISNAYIAWMTAFFSLASAVLAPVMGRISDLIGLKKIVLLGFLCFGLGCLAMSITPNFPIMLFGRFIQGIGLACVAPATMAFAGRFFGAEKVASAYAIFGGTCTAGPIFGPVLSGFLVQSFGWRSMFLFASVATAISLILVFFFMPTVPIIQMKAKKFDVFGSVFLLIAIGSLLLLPTLASQKGWGSPLALLFIALFVIFIIVFGINERKVESPLINLSFVGRRAFVVPALHYFIICGVMQAYLYMMSYFLTVGLGKPTTLSGTWTTIIFIASTLGAPIAAKLLQRYRWKPLAFACIILYMGAAGIFCTATVSVSIIVLMLGAILMGLGTAINAPLAMDACLSGIAPEDRGSVSGTFRMTSDIGGPMGVQVFVPLMSIIAVNANGTPDFVASFSKVSVIILIVLAISSVLAFIYPKNTPAGSKKA